MNAQLHPCFVEIYLRCKANPAFHVPGTAEDTHAFVLDMDRKLSRLSSISQKIIELTAEGYSTKEIASQVGRSPRYVHMKIDRLLWVGPDAYYRQPIS
jgi:DNA-binding NarL/FixJ family response regulator